MAKYAYRCMKCRTRNMFNKRLEEYKHKKKCKNCDHFRFYWDKARNLRTFQGIGQRAICYCSSYSHPHNEQARFCSKNKNSEFDIRVERYGEDALQVAADLGFDNNEVLGKNEVCPF